MTQSPRIAVIIPAHNSEKTLPRTLQSLVANKVPHDIVIVDDASHTPVTKIVALPPNATVLRLDENRGVTAATNHGLRYILEKGYDYVARLDSDDTAFPDRLQLQLDYLDKHAYVALLGGAGEVVSETGETLFYLNHPTDFKTIQRKLFYNSCFLQPSFMIRTIALRNYGLYNEDFPNAEDYELVRRISKYAKIENLPQYLIRYTVSSGGLSVSKRKQQLRLRLKVQWMYRDFGSIHFYLGILKTLILWNMPMGLIAACKRQLGAYKRKN